MTGWTRVWVMSPFLAHKRIIITDKHSPVTNMAQGWTLSVLQTNPFAKGSHYLNISELQSLFYFNKSMYTIREKYKDKSINHSPCKQYSKGICLKRIQWSGPFILRALKDSAERGNGNARSSIFAHIIHREI